MVTSCRLGIIIIIIIKIIIIIIIITVTINMALYAWESPKTKELNKIVKC